MDVHCLGIMDKRTNTEDKMYTTEKKRMNQHVQKHEYRQKL